MQPNIVKVHVHVVIKAGCVNEWAEEYQYLFIGR